MIVNEYRLSERSHLVITSAKGNGGPYYPLEVCVFIMQCYAILKGGGMGVGGYF